jgi:low temperature requirement protein LtrA
MMLGGPALFLLGERLFVWRVTTTTHVTRVAVAGILMLLVPVGGQLSALLLGVMVGALLTALALWELRASAFRGSERARRDSNLRPAA